ncbi:hypothetical protein IQ06DRAFT_376554 [Phaeosphaeriaceae sp. SRC1lsM3a]|nr:hypothetical protein IQ06DRAFT_376554 [Stagonospora sp. SRC1lsM3a]
MSESTGPRYTWAAEHNRYAEYILNQSGNWVFVQWMPQGWQQPTREQQPRAISPSTPQRKGDRDSGYGASPRAAAFAQTGQTLNASPNSGVLGSYQYTYGTNNTLQSPSTIQTQPGYAQPGSAHAASSSDISRLPKGQGAKLRGQYNAQLGTTDNNLHYEKLDPSYYVRDRQFFEEGKVFQVILSENAGNTATSYNSSISEVRFEGHYVFTQARRFVVVRQRREFCYACPIFTYSLRGTTKKGVRPEEHGVAYSYGQKATLLQGETGIKKPSIAINMAPGEPSLHVASRIYYGIHHPVQYNVKVKDIGHVLPSYLHALIGNWKSEDNGETKQAAEVTAGAEDDELDDISEESASEENPVSGRELGNIHGQNPQNRAPNSTAVKDPNLYHPKNNIYGYDKDLNPQVWHPKYNRYGYHPKHNTIGYHPSSNPFSYHPDHNPHGHHPKHNPHGYHPTHNTAGYNPSSNAHVFHPDHNPHGHHQKHNPQGYHPSRNPTGYHPLSNPYRYHPDHNVTGYHSSKNVYSYHPDHNPHGYHPQIAQFCWHPKFCPYGYHSQKNLAGFHPQTAPDNFHPEGNPLGFHPSHHTYEYHPVHNMHAFHKKNNPHGFHPTHYPYAYHPTLNKHFYHEEHNRFGYHPTYYPNSYHPNWQPNGKLYDDEGNIIEDSEDEEEEEEDQNEAPDLYTAE